MTRENGYNMPPKGLFGKRCRIKHCLDLKRGFVYRIVNDGVKSNTWRELPLGIYGKEPVQHDTFEDVVFVVCDTLIDESSKIEKVALKDIEIIEEEPRKGHWIEVTNGRGGHECDVCHDYAPSFKSGNEYLSAFCPNCGADMREVEE